MQQQTGALQMAQELMAQAGTFGGPFDQARHIGDHKALVFAHAHHAEIGVKCGEWVVGNLRARVGDRRDQRRLAGVGHAQQTDIGQHAQLELDLEALTRPTRRGLARRAVGAGLEVQVAKAAIAALGQHHLLARHQQLGQLLAGFGVADDGADRHAQHNVVASCTELIRTATGFAMASLMPSGVAVVDQRVQIQIGHGIDMAATPTVAPIGTTEGNEFLAPKAGTATATVACGHLDGDFIDEFHGNSCCGTNDQDRAVKAKSPGEAGAFGIQSVERLSRSQRCDEHRLAILRALHIEGHRTVDQRKQRVVTAHADIGASMETGTALTHDDRTGADRFTAVCLHAQHLGLRVAAVPCGTAALFLCHDLTPWRNRKKPEEPLRPPLH